jgi:hypothetical protein
LPNRAHDLGSRWGVRRRDCISAHRWVWMPSDGMIQEMRVWRLQYDHRVMFLVLSYNFLVVSKIPYREDWMIWGAILMLL